MPKVLNPAEVQHLTGHLDPATTDHYRRRVSRLEDVDQDRSSRLDFDARTKKDHPTDDPFSFERETGLEPAASTLARSRSTN